MFQSAKSRRAAFANMRKTQLRHIPIQGHNTRNQRNRILATGISAGALLGTGAYYSEGGRRAGAFRSLTGLRGESTPWRVVHVSRGKSLGEDVSMGGEHLDRMGTYHAGGRDATLGEKQLGKILKGMSPSLASRLGFRGSLVRGWEVGSEPLDARIAARLKRAVGERVERASLWNIMGKHGSLLEGIEAASLHGQEAVRNAIKGSLTGVTKYVERKLTLRRRILRPFFKLNFATRNIVRRAGRGLVTMGSRRLV